MKPTTKRKIRKIFAPFRKIGLNNKTFSIISMDCYGGIIYDILGLEYKSPTVGLLLTGEDFVKFCCNIEYYISLEMIPDQDVNSRLQKEAINDKNNFFPRWIGHVGDLTIRFIHYKNALDAVEKWNRRRTRVNLNNLIIVFDDKANHHLQPDDIDRLVRLPYTKIFITIDKENVKKYNFAYYVGGPTMKDVFRCLPLRKVKQILNKNVESSF